MKKMLLLLLSCLYLVASIGTQVQQHYCMGHLKAITVGFNENKKCGTCGMEAGSSKCCHDESQWLKLKDSHPGTIVSTDVPTPFLMDLPPERHFYLQPVTSLVVASQVSNHSPPLLLLNRNALFCIFRI